MNEAGQAMSKSIEEQAAEMAPKAHAAMEAGHNGRCILCGQGVFYIPHSEGVRKGHIYSEAGAREFRISSSCEFCFDQATLPE